MPLIILLALLLVPIAEITVFIEIGDKIGAGPVIVATLTTAIVGLAIARAQGLSVLRQMGAELEAGRAPVAGMIHGFFLLLAGLALLLPGFLTDILGAILLIPAIRALLGRAILARVALNRAAAGRSRSGATIVEGEYWEGQPNEAEDDQDHRRLTR